MKITQEYESAYDVGDFVAFKKDGLIYVGRIVGFNIDDGNFWFNIKVNKYKVFSYANGGDVAEWDIVFKLNEEQVKILEKLEND